MRPRLRYVTYIAIERLRQHVYRIHHLQRKEWEFPGYVAPPIQYAHLIDGSSANEDDWVYEWRDTPPIRYDKRIHDGC